MKPDHKRIWLQPGAGDCGETTWCQDRIHDDDIEYIRADIHDQALLSARNQGRDEGLKEAARVIEAGSVMAHSGAVHPTGKAHAAAIRAKIGEHGNG